MIPQYFKCSAPDGHWTNQGTITLGQERILAGEATYRASCRVRSSSRCCSDAGLIQFVPLIEIDPVTPGGSGGGGCFPNCVQHADGTTSKLISCPQSDGTHTHYDPAAPGNAQELVELYTLDPTDVVKWCECPTCDPYCTDILICLSKPPVPPETEPEKMVVLGELTVDGMCMESYLDDVTQIGGATTTLTALQADGWEVGDHYDNEAFQALFSGVCVAPPAEETEPPVAGAAGDTLNSVAFPEVCMTVGGVTGQYVVPVVTINATTNAAATVAYFDKYGNLITDTVTQTDECNCDCVDCA